MRKVLAPSLFIIVLALLTPLSVSAHSGRTDSNGGHNCRTGACAGTYHYHNGGGSAPQPYTAPVQQQYIAPQPVYTPTVTYGSTTSTKVVKFKTTEKNDKTLLEGKTKVKTKGVNGVETSYYTITYTDNVETGKVFDRKEVTKNPVNKVILIGTKEKPEPVPEPVEDIEELTSEVLGDSEKDEEPTTGDTVGGLITMGVIGYLGKLAYKNEGNKTRARNFKYKHGYRIKSIKDKARKYKK